MRRPFCYKKYDLTTYTYVSVWYDGLQYYDDCKASAWRGRICRAYSYHYGTAHPDVSTIPDLINEACFIDIFGKFEFGGDGSSFYDEPEEETQECSKFVTYCP